MGFTLQGAGPFLHWLTLVILFAMPVVLAFVVYKLGSLPGEIGRARHHPQAEAISVCGWMGIITLVLWPVAMVWAHLKPVSGSGVQGTLSESDTPLLIGKLQAATQRLAAIEENLAKSSAGGGA